MLCLKLPFLVVTASSKPYSTTEKPVKPLDETRKGTNVLLIIEALIVSSDPKTLALI